MRLFVWLIIASLGYSEEPPHIGHIAKTSAYYRNSREGASTSGESMGKGLFVILHEPQRELPPIEYELLSGARFGYKWVEVEKEEGVYDFSEFDKVLDSWFAVGKKCIIGIAVGYLNRGGQATPEWLFDKVDYATMTTLWHGEVKIPVYWDEDYLSYYKKLIDKFAEEFDGDPRVEMIELCWGQFATTRLPDKIADVLEQKGYSYERFFDTVKEICGYYKSAFKKTPLVMTVSTDIATAEDKRRYWVAEAVEFAAENGINIYNHALTGEGRKGNLPIRIYSSLFNYIHSRYSDVKFCLGPDNPLSSPQYQNVAGTIGTAVRFAIGDTYDSNGNYLPKTYLNYGIFYYHDIATATAGNVEFDAAFRYLVEYLEPTDKPRFIKPLVDCVLDEDTTLENAINLWEYVEDYDTPDENLSFSIMDASDFGISVVDNRWIKVAPKEGFNGKTDAVIQAEDRDGNIATTTLRVIVNPVNDPPKLSEIANITAEIGESIELDINAEDMDDDRLFWKVYGLPEGAEFDTKTYKFSWTPTKVGTYTIGFKVRDRERFEIHQNRGIIQFFTKDDPVDANIDNPYLLGAKVSAQWSEIEPEEGEYNWEVLDNRIKLWVDAGKKVRLGIYISGWAGWNPQLKCGTPKWVFEKKGARYLQYNYKTGSITTPAWDILKSKDFYWDDSDYSTTYPIIWDAVFKQEYEKLISALASKYNNNPNILYIQIGLFPELTLGKDAKVLKDHWISEGYSYDVYVDAIKWMIDINKKYLTNIPCSLALNAPAIMNLEEKARLWQEISSYLSEKDCFLQNNSFKQTSHYDYWAQRMFRKYHKTTGIVYQAVASAKQQPERMGSFSLALYNALTAHADFLEIYAKDIEEASQNFEWEEALKFAKEHVGIEPADAKDVWIMLTDYSTRTSGGNDFYSGLYQVDVKDGGTPEPFYIAGKGCRRTTSDNPYIYLQIDPEFMNGGFNLCTITLCYLDIGTDTFSLEYDSVNNIYKSAGTVRKKNTGRWLFATFTLTDAHFTKRQEGGTTKNEAVSLEEKRAVSGTDFRINSNSDGAEYIHFVQAKKEKPGLSDIEAVTITVKGADIVLQKSADKKYIALGQEMTYTITYTNKGSGTATDIIIIEVLPEKCKIKNAKSKMEAKVDYWVDGRWQSEFSEKAEKIRWTIPEVAPAESGSVSFVCEVKR